MSENGRAATPQVAVLTRRALLTSSLSLPLLLVACGDESDTREFAGGPQTSGPDEVTNEAGEPANAGSPTAVPTQMPISELLEPRGETDFALIQHANRLTTVELETGDAKDVWSNADRRIWAAAGTPSGDRVALLSAPNGAAAEWTIDFIASSGDPIALVELGTRTGTPDQLPDAVAAGRGGLTWIGDTERLAVAIPSGGLQQVGVDGSQEQLLAASRAKRPAAVAVTSDGATIAYVDQPTGSAGSGIYAGSMRAAPIDPVEILAADRTGNRYAHDLSWVSSGDRLATVIERQELGDPQGDLFYVDTNTGRPTVAWTSPAGREVWSVEAFAVSEDGAVVTFLTNPSSTSSTKSSSIWLMQIDGAAVERFDLPVQLRESRLVFSPQGVAASGLVESEDIEESMGAVYLVTAAGEVIERYLERIEATPVASPEASPAASPVASPGGDVSPVAATPVE